MTPLSSKNTSRIVFFHSLRLYHCYQLLALFLIVAIENILTTGMYNDIGIMVRDKMILLIEVQSTFSVNIVLRILLYLTATYKEYAEEQKLNLYGAEPVIIPHPELYVVYTGDREDVPETLLLSDLYGGSGDAEVRVKVLRGTGNGDIVDQYVRFCKIADEERQHHRRSARQSKKLYAGVSQKMDYIDEIVVDTDRNFVVKWKPTT